MRHFKGKKGIMIIAPHGCSASGDIYTEFISNIIIRYYETYGFINYGIGRPYKTRGELASPTKFDHNDATQLKQFARYTYYDLMLKCNELVARYGYALIINLHGCADFMAQKNKDVSVSIGCGFPDRLTAKLGTTHKFIRILNNEIGLTSRIAHISTKMGAYSRLNLTQAINEYTPIVNNDILQIEIRNSGHRDTVDNVITTALSIGKAIDTLYQYKISRL